MRHESRAVTWGEKNWLVHNLPSESKLPRHMERVTARKAYIHSLTAKTNQSRKTFNNSQCPPSFPLSTFHRKFCRYTLSQSHWQTHARTYGLQTRCKVDFIFFHCSQCHDTACCVCVCGLLNCLFVCTGSSAGYDLQVVNIWNCECDILFSFFDVYSVAFIAS